MQLTLYCPFFYLGLSMFRINNDKTITTSAKTLQKLYNKWQKGKKTYLGRGRHNAITFEEHKNVNRGFRVLFHRKDIQLSIVFGCGQYCQHYDNILECRNLFPQTLPWESMDCEVGTLSINRDSPVWYNLPQKYGMHQNGVYAYQTPEQVDSLINYILREKRQLNFAQRKLHLTSRRVKLNRRKLLRTLG